MTTIHSLTLACMIVLAFQHVHAVPTGDEAEDLYHTLLRRIETLENNDAENKAKIIEMETEFELEYSDSEKEIIMLKQRMDQMESDFKQREAKLLKKMKASQVMPADSSNERTETLMDRNDDVEKAQQKEVRSRMSRKYRDSPEMETAFYATHNVWGNHHLGANQILPFQLIVTNVGNAYNNHSSTFVAPVDGTYVFHATVMGLDMPNGDTHIRAHFDVDDTPYSVFYVTPYDQSSQMLVINLTAGQTVALRNDFSNDGFVGTHHSSFCGFLLYQHSNSPAVIGK